MEVEQAVAQRPSPSHALQLCCRACTQLCALLLVQQLLYLSCCACMQLASCRTQESLLGSKMQSHSGPGV